VAEHETVSVMDGLWELSPDGEQARLIGSKCLNCGELYFPKREKSICIHCQETKLEQVALSNRGKISSFTVVYQPPAGGYYKGPVPYAYGFVELPEKVKIMTLFTGCDLETLEVGAEVGLVIEKLFDEDDGTAVISYKFKPLD
jgi:uncharacterized protein